MAAAFHEAWARAQQRMLALLTEDGERIGHVAAWLPPPRAHEDPMGIVVDLWVDPRHRGRGLGRLARDHAQAWTAGQGAARFGVKLWGDDPAAAALFGSMPLRSRRMIKRMGAIPELPPGVTARPMTQAEFLPWRESEVVGYAADLANSGSLTPEQAAKASAESYDELLPEGLDTPGNEWAVVDAGGVAVATIWLNHDSRMVPSFVYSVEVRPDHRGNGYGRAAMHAGEALTIRAGHSHLGLNVFGHNTVAMRLYDSLGYAVAEESRSVDVA